MGVGRGNGTDMMPHGLSSKQGRPLKALVGPGMNDPLTKSQKNLRKKMPHIPAHSVSARGGLAFSGIMGVEHAQMEAKMATYWAH